MTFRTTIAVLGILAWVNSSWSQSAQEGLLFSQDDIVGTARYNAMGGAFSALGGDWSAVTQNPAGMGVYRTSEFSISPALHVNMTESDYNGNSQLDGKSNFNFGNLSIVGVQPVRERGRWRSTAIGAGLSRMASYHKEYSASANDVNTSMLNDFTNVLNESGFSWQELDNGEIFPFDVQLAWLNFLIDTLPGGNGFKDTLGNTSTNQTFNYEARGAKRETFFTAGANYDDKLYLGVGLDISRIVYERETRFSEFVPTPESLFELKEYSFLSNDTYDGRGFAINAGVIYRPIDQLRISLAGRTPTWYSFDYVFTTSMNASYEIGDVFESLSPEGTFNFRLRTPWKTNLGLAYVIGKHGLISAEAEYMDHTSARYSNAAGETAGQAFLNQLNDELSTGLRPVINYRFGGEYRITQFYSARVGFAHFANPYDSSIDNDGSFQVYSLGAGFRDEIYSVDVAYQLRASTDRVYVYDPAIAEPLDVTATDHRITLTLGLRF